MKQRTGNTTKVCLMLLVALFAFAQGSWAQEKKAPKLSLSQKSYEYEVYGAVFEAPQLTIDVDGNTDPYNDFSRKYNIVGADGNIIEGTKSENSDFIYSVDPVTGTKVKVDDGLTFVGGHVGKVTVRLTLTPHPECASQYSNPQYTIDYTIRVTKGNANLDLFAIRTADADMHANQNYNIALLIKADNNYYQSTNKPSYSFFKVSRSTYKLDANFAKRYGTKDIEDYIDTVNSVLGPENWEITSEMTDPKTDAFTVKDNIITAAKPGSGSVKFTIKPKGSIAEDYKPIEKDVNINVLEADPNKKISVHLKFYYDHQYDNKKDENELSVTHDSYAQKGGTFEVPVWQKDDKGNDIHQLQFNDEGTLITHPEHFDQFVYEQRLQKFYFLKANVIDEYGNDVTDKYEYDNNPYTIISDTSTTTKTQFYSYQKALTEVVNAQAGNIWRPADVGNGFIAAAPNKLVIQLNAKPKNDYNQLFGPVSGTYTLAIMPRVPQIKFSVDPSTVPLTAGYVMTPSNRFILEPYFVNLLSGDTIWFTYNTVDPNYHKGSYQGGSYSYSLDINENKYADNIIIDERSYSSKVEYNRGRIKYSRYLSKRGWANDDLNITFKKANEYTLKYAVIPTSANVFLPGEIALTYIVKPKFDVKMTISPDTYITYVKQNIQKPTIKIVRTDTGEDVTKHYSFKFSIPNSWDSNATKWSKGSYDRATDVSVSEDDELSIGAKPENLTVTVAASGLADDEYAYPDCTGTYTVEVKEKPNPMCSWEIIKADDPADALMGKLHFTGAGGLSAGYQISNAVPGLNIMFGKSGEEDLQAKPEIAQTEGEGNTGDIKGGNKQYISGAKVTTDENGLPTSGTFFVLQPYTNGFVSADAYWESGNSYILTDATGKQIESISGDGSFSTKTFSTALRAGQTYYLYATGTAMKLHGLAYDPAFLADGSNEKVAAISIIGGNTSTVPHLLSEATSNVELSANPAEDITQWTDGDMPVLPERIEKDIDATISAKVNSLYTDGNVNSGDIFKQPSYRLKVTAIPSYWVADGRYAGNGQEVTTTNIPTNIRMYYGGWEGGANSPYMKDGNQEADMADNWTMAMAATEEKGIDGFKFVTSVTNIPRDERGWGMGQNERFKKYNLDAFNVPCRGSFVRFEPEENGTVIVYLMQNGICQWNSALQGWGTNKTLQWNNVYITDETGANVALTDNLWGENNGAKDGGLYTTSKIQASLFGLENNGNAPKSAETRDGSNWDWDTEFLKAGNGTEEDKQELFANWTQKNIGDLSKAMRFSDGGLGVISDGYTRYTFKVKAGKTYFVSQRDAQLAFAGFSFVPEGFSSTYSKDAPVPGHTDKTYELDQNNKNNEEFLNKIKSESTDASAYSNVNVRLNRTFAQGKWAPLCLPFSVNQTQFKQIFGDDALIITFDYIRPNKTAHYTQHVYHYIEAGRPYFVKPSKKVDAGTTTTTFKHVSLEGAPRIIMTQDCPETAPFNYKFVGFYDPMNIPQYSYYMTTNNEIRRVEAAYKPMKGFRAYLEYDEDHSTVSAAEAKILDDETATGIKTISVAERGDDGNQLLPNNSNVYDVSGRLVNRKGSTEGLQRGVYISRGKKVVVK